MQQLWWGKVINPVPQSQRWGLHLPPFFCVINIILSQKKRIYYIVPEHSCVRKQCEAFKNNKRIGRFHIVTAEVPTAAIPFRCVYTQHASVSQVFPYFLCDSLWMINWTYLWRVCFGNSRPHRLLSWVSFEVPAEFWWKRAYVFVLIKPWDAKSGWSEKEHFGGKSGQMHFYTTLKKPSE